MEGNKWEIGREKIMPINVEKDERTGMEVRLIFDCGLRAFTCVEFTITDLNCNELE